MKLVNFSIEIGKKQILTDINVEFSPGNLYIIKGSNGSGKSTLLNTLAGLNDFQASGQILHQDQDITSLSPQKRFEIGMYLSFQEPPEIKGVSIIQFLKAALLKPRSKYTKLSELLQDLKNYQSLLGLSEDFYTRDMHYGLSGGQKKRLEILQLLMFDNDILLLDEIDTGLDLEGLSILANIISEQLSKSKTILITSHNQNFIGSIAADNKTYFEIQDQTLKSI